MGGAAPSSTIVFHPPHASQRPDHLEWTVPQDWQAKEREDLAMSRYSTGVKRLSLSSLVLTGEAPSDSEAVGEVPLRRFAPPPPVSTAGLSHMSDEVEEEGIVPACAEDFSP